MFFMFLSLTDYFFFAFGERNTKEHDVTDDTADGEDDYIGTN